MQYGDDYILVHTRKIATYSYQLACAQNLGHILDFVFLHVRIYDMVLVTVSACVGVWHDGQKLLVVHVGAWDVGFD